MIHKFMNHEIFTEIGAVEGEDFRVNKFVNPEIDNNNTLHKKVERSK